MYKKDRMIVGCYNEYKCPLCNYIAKNKLAVKMHIKINHYLTPERETIHAGEVCNYCNKLFANKKSVNHHMMKFH